MGVEMSERYDAYEELGGHSSEPNEGQEQAMYNMGLGSKEMRARVEARDSTAQNAMQYLVNKAGAALDRQAVVDSDKAKGVDTNSQEYQLKQIKEERARTRRF